jgi:hypothetical protein
MIFRMIIRPYVLYKPLCLRTVSVRSESSVNCPTRKTGLNPDYDVE